MANTAALALRLLEHNLCVDSSWPSKPFSQLVEDCFIVNGLEVSAVLRGPMTIEELSKQAESRGLLQHDLIVVIAGADYANMLKRVFVCKERLLPLKGAPGNGVMMRRMKEAIERGVEQYP